ncbi:helix-turn-helix domain-containing protein [Methylobacterium flocculans]|uniref:helix-turn-helix domain-containing protein n=1 Tax=Methylobacterium flocculans TaxID=2984843 RepID=UPI00384F303D
MRKDTSVDALLNQLNSLAERDDWTQSEMAERLGISQGQLSKVLRGRHRPGRRLTAAIGKLILSDEQPFDAWLSSVSTAARTSADFRAAIDAMLRVMRSHALNAAEGDRRD